MHLRHYEKVRQEKETLIIKPTNDKIARAGENSSISDEKDNTHWFIANTVTAFKFDNIMLNLKDKPYDIHNPDIYKKTEFIGWYPKSSYFRCGDGIEKIWK